MNLPIFYGLNFRWKIYLYVILPDIGAGDETNMLSTWILIWEVGWRPAHLHLQLKPGSQWEQEPSTLSADQKLTVLISWGLSYNISYAQAQWKRVIIHRESITFHLRHWKIRIYPNSNFLARYKMFIRKWQFSWPLTVCSSMHWHKDHLHQCCKRLSVVQMRTNR